jgi:hypothetical protein
MTKQRKRPAKLSLSTVQLASVRGAAGEPTDKRVHKPIEITIEIDAAFPIWL